MRLTACNCTLDAPASLEDTRTYIGASISSLAPRNLFPPSHFNIKWSFFAIVLACQYVVIAASRLRLLLRHASSAL